MGLKLGLKALVRLGFVLFALTGGNEGPEQIDAALLLFSSAFDEDDADMEVKVEIEPKTP